MPRTTNIFVDGSPWSVSNTLVLPADGTTYKTIKIVYGSPSTSGNAVSLEPTCVAAISSVEGEVDINSAFEFIVGPDHRRGNVDIVISCAPYPTKTLQVSFR